MIDLEKISIPASFKYRVMFFSGASMHSIFIIFFAVLGVPPLIFFNICSVSLYILGGFFCINKKTGKVRLAWLTMFYFEVIIHGLLCTIFIGWESCFSWYPIITLAVAAYVLFMMVDLKRFIKLMVPLMITPAAATLLVLFLMWGREPVYTIAKERILVISYINFSFSFLLIVSFSLLFLLEIVDANRRLEYTAKHDELTGLVNRHSLAPVYKELENAEEYCVALGDIDDFKKINDTFGHNCGDIVLKSVAETIEKGIGEGDIACRWGGEEILIIMKGTKEASLERVEEIRRNIFAMDTVYSGMNVRVSMTFGFASKEESEKGIEALISKADDRLYVGKRSGKNVVVSS